MKRFKLVLSLLLAAILLMGCQKAGGDTTVVTDNGGNTSESIELDSFYDNYQAYTKYLSSTEYDDNDFSYEYNEADEGGYDCYLYNDSDDLFATGVFNLYDTATASTPLCSTQVGLIRPHDYNYVTVNEDEYGEYFDVTEVSAYSFSYDATIDYEFMPDYLNDDNCNDVIIDGTFTMDDVKSIAQREYIINILTNIPYKYVYFFDGTHTMDPDYPDYPDPTTAVYIAQFDFDNKTINIIEGNDPYAATSESITME